MSLEGARDENGNGFDEQIQEETSSATTTIGKFFNMPIGHPGKTALQRKKHEP